jgi:hypothetical protein
MRLSPWPARYFIAAVRCSREENRTIVRPDRSVSVLFQVNFIELPFTFSCPYRYFEHQGAEFSICSWRFCVAEFTRLGAIFDDNNHAADKTCRAALPR